MADTDENQGKLFDSEAVKAAEARAIEAEKKAAALEAETKRREDAAIKAKRDKELQDLAEAKRLLAEVEAREKAAQEKADALLAKERERIEAQLGNLDDDARERVSRYKDKLSLDDWAQMIADEAGRSSSHGSNMPPPGNAQGGRRTGVAGNREMHPESARILDTLVVDQKAAREAQVVVKEGDKARFVFPVDKMLRLIRERAMRPSRLDAETYRKLFEQ